MYDYSFFHVFRFMPEPMVLALRDKAGSASLQLLDSVCENPELIWTAEMQGELRTALSSLLEGADASDAEAFRTPPAVGPDYFVKFRQIQHEIYVGGVYIRLYLKQPTFRLSNAILFLEKLVEFWESSFTIQVPAATTNTKMASIHSAAGSDSRALVLGNEDFIGLLTSCIVCCVKGEPSVVDHLIAWGFVHNLPVLLQRALKAGRRGTPMVCVVRILFALVPRLEVVENLASSKIDLIEQLTLCLKDGDSVPRDAAVVVELLKKIYQTPYCRHMDQFVTSALRVNLPTLVLNKVLGAPAADLSHVANVPALRIHAVDLLKAILAAGDEAAVAQLQALLDLHPAWKEFKHQRHDLFLSVGLPAVPALPCIRTDSVISRLCLHRTRRSRTST
jgi:DnaJ family protein C protein 13